MLYYIIIVPAANFVELILLLPVLFVVVVSVISVIKELFCFLVHYIRIRINPNSCQVDEYLLPFENIVVVIADDDILDSFDKFLKQNRRPKCDQSESIDRYCCLLPSL